MVNELLLKEEQEGKQWLSLDSEVLKAFVIRRQPNPEAIAREKRFLTEFCEGLLSKRKAAQSSN